MVKGFESIQGHLNSASHYAVYAKMADRTTHTIPIPGPPGLPLVGNALAIDKELPLRTFQDFAEEYGKLEQHVHALCYTVVTELNSRRDIPAKPPRGAYGCRCKPLQIPAGAGRPRC